MFWLHLTSAACLGIACVISCKSSWYELYGTAQQELKQHLLWCTHEWYLRFEAFMANKCTKSFWAIRHIKIEWKIYFFRDMLLSPQLYSLLIMRTEQISETLVFNSLSMWLTVQEAFNHDEHCCCNHHHLHISDYLQISDFYINFS
jgi:hypothetical protein